MQHGSIGLLSSVVRLAVSWPRPTCAVGRRSSASDAADGRPRERSHSRAITDDSWRCDAAECAGRAATASASGTESAAAG